jgi:hypothetical protein
MSILVPHRFFQLGCTGVATLLFLMSAAVSAQTPAAQTSAAQTSAAQTSAAKGQPPCIGSLTAYGRHFPNGKAAVEYIMGPDGLWKHMTHLEYIWNYYGNLPYSNFPVPARHPENLQALIDAADGTRNFTCLAVNSNLMCDSKHRGEIDGTDDYNHDGYPDIPDAGWGFCETNGKGVGGVTRQKPFTVFWYDDNWVAKLFTQAYGKSSPDGVYEYANNHNHWQPLCRVIRGNYNPYQVDYPNTVELDALYYLWTGDKAKALSLWDHLRDQCHPVWDPSLQRYQYSVASDGTYIFGVFKILTDSLLEHGLLTAPKREELLQHSVSLRSFLISLQEKDSQGNLLGWNGAVGHAEGLINTEGTFMSILGLSPIPGSEVYEAGQSPLSFESKNYTLRPSNVYSSVSSLSQPGYMTSGPNYIYPAGGYQVDYYLRCPSPPANAKIASLSVAPSHRAGASLCSENIESSVFRGHNWIKRTLAFTLAHPTPLSFRTYWWGKADMDIACIQVRRIK